MPTHQKLTQVPRVIHDILDVVGRPEGSYVENFVSISLLLAYLTQVPGVIHDILDILGEPQGSYPESFVSISLLLAEI